MTIQLNNQVIGRSTYRLRPLPPLKEFRTAILNTAEAWVAFTPGRLYSNDVITSLRCEAAEADGDVARAREDRIPSVMADVLGGKCEDFGEKNRDRFG